MRRRLLLSYLSITIFVLLVLEIPLGFAYTTSERRRLTSAVQHDALSLSIRAEEGLERNDVERALRSLVNRYQHDTGARVVIVARDGTLLADSDPPRSGPRNFDSRPEFRAALRGKEPSGTRYSDTLGASFLYFAVPIVNGNQVVGALRVTHPTSFVDARIRRTWFVLAGVGIVILGVVFLVSLRLARQVTKPLDDLERAAGDLGAGDLDARAPVPDGPPELRRLAESFNTTATRLQDLVASQQAFVADACPHQLRTPLAALRLRLENLEGELDQAAAPGGVEEIRDDATGALAEVGRLSRLVDGLLELARAEQVEGAPEPVELARLVGSASHAWSALADERDIALVAEVPDTLRASSTPGRLEQVLDNLVANTLEVAPAGTAVRVVAARTSGAVELSVVDAGPGLTPEQRARAFDRFWRPSGADRDGGSGLGLAIVARLVSADGGTVALHEAPGGGLAATVTLRPA